MPLLAKVWHPRGWIPNHRGLGVLLYQHSVGRAGHAAWACGCFGHSVNYIIVCFPPNWSPQNSIELFYVPKSHVPKSDSIDPQPEVTDFQPDGSLAAKWPDASGVFWATWQHEIDLTVHFILQWILKAMSIYIYIYLYSIWLGSHMMMISDLKYIIYSAAVSRISR